MNNFQRNIYRTVENASLPSYYEYNISSGSQYCEGGYTNISSPVTKTVYTSVPRPSWMIGTELYSDSALTTLITDTYIRSVVSGTVDLFYAVLSPAGVIDEIIPPLTPC